MPLTVSELRAVMVALGPISHTHSHAVLACGRAWRRSLRPARGGIRRCRTMWKEKHHVAVHAGDEVGGVVAHAHAAHADALEVLRAATAGQAEVGFHLITVCMYSIRDEPRC